MLVRYRARLMCSIVRYPGPPRVIGWPAKASAIWSKRTKQWALLVAFLHAHLSFEDYVQMKRLFQGNQRKLLCFCGAKKP